MLEPRPPRRDPRVLALVPNGHGISYAVADAWEVRGVGVLPNATAAALRLAVTRVIVQTRPSAIVCAEPSRGSRLLRTILRVAIETDVARDLVHGRGSNFMQSSPPR